MTDLSQLTPDHDPVPTNSNPVGAVVPSEAVRAELEHALEADEQLLGDVWRRRRAGESPEQIQAARGASRPNFVWSYDRILRALLEGDLPSAPTVSLQIARALRGFLSRTSLTTETAAILRQNVAALESGSASEAAREVEDTEARVVTSQAEAQAIPGVYVYALPHYLRYPYDAESGRTLLKVGHSSRSVLQRFHEQTRTTALPEDPVLLRIYPTLDATEIERERQFHELLEAADHDRSRARTGGTEWFLTSLRFLDTVAKTVGLEVRHIYDPGTE
jgi:hypothetical protein